MIDKLRKKLNNSASLGKTLARTQQHHFSHFAEPKEFELRSLNQSRQSSKKIGRKSMIETPKLSAPKAVPANLYVGDSLIKIQLNRQKCVKIGQDVHTATVDKNLRLNKMYKELHHFSVCVDELKWLLTEGDTLIRAYLSQTSLIAPNSSHTLDVTNIAQEFRTLVLRFAHIQKNKLIDIEDYLKKSKCQQLKMGVHDMIFIQDKNNPSRNQLHTFPEENVSIASKELPKESQNTSFIQTRHFSVPLKENINSSNMPHFDNIRLLKCETTKLKPNPNANKQPLISQSIQEKDESSQREKQELYSKLRRGHQKNEELLGKIESLKEEISSLQQKMLKYKVSSSKSIVKFADVLKKLMNNPTQQEKEFELLKMAQTIKSWEKMIEDDLHAAKYREIYGSPQTFQLEKTQKMKEIIGLQYEINNLLGQRQQFQQFGAMEIDKTMEQSALSEDLYRMLVTQACTLEQLCSL